MRLTSPSYDDHGDNVDDDGVIMDEVVMIMVITVMMMMMLSWMKWEERLH